MKKMYLIAFMTVSFLVFSAGCQESTKNDAKKEKLSAHTSHQLRLQLTEKDKQIARLQLEIEQCQAEVEKQKQLAVDCMTDKGNEFMEMIVPIMDEFDKAKEENDKLKAQIKELTKS